MRLVFPHCALVFGMLFLPLGVHAVAAVTVQARIDPPEVNVGDQVTVTFTVQGGSVNDIQLPPVDGLAVAGTSTSSQFVMNGFSVSQSVVESFSLVPTRAGDFTIPSFSIHADGQIVHTPPLRLHVLGATSNPSPSAASAAPGPGPVVMPPTASGQTSSQITDDGTGGKTISVPTDADGEPARVFHLITPRTTDAYVGESIPLNIQFYIRADSNAQQNSLPTLIGSDFLMNNLSLRPAEDGVGIGNEEYIRDTWITAISAPKAGDFPLEATRDTYWNQGSASSNDPFGGLFGRSAPLTHKEVGSNKLIIHVHPLPDAGRPANFTGAIGNFHVTGSAIPTTVGVGEPVTLHFTITGEGNFDYVRCPALEPDTAWHSYVPSSKIEYEEDSHTQGTKTFDQAVIPQRNGTLALPAASFSYFDPDAKHYVTIPVPLPAIVVTGEMPLAAAAPPPDVPSVESASSHLPAADAFFPNGLALGALTPDLAPSYRHSWFWILQTALFTLILLGLLPMVLRPRLDPQRAERALLRTSLLREEEAMDQAAREDDPVRFFTAARHRVQLQLAERWQAPPETLTLSEIAHRDAALGDAVAPLFYEADDIIYSGRTATEVDLREWESRVRGILESARS